MYRCCTKLHDISCSCQLYDAWPVAMLHHVHKRCSPRHGGMHLCLSFLCVLAKMLILTFIKWLASRWNQLQSIIRPPNWLCPVGKDCLLPLP